MDLKSLHSCPKEGNIAVYVEVQTGNRDPESGQDRFISTGIADVKRGIIAAEQIFFQKFQQSFLVVDKVWSHQFEIFLCGLDENGCFPLIETPVGGKNRR